MEGRRARPEAEAEAETFTFPSLACVVTLATAGGAGQRARIKMSLSGPNIRVALSNVGDEGERGEKRVERNMVGKKFILE